MDQAKGILAFIQAKHPDKGYSVDRVMSELLVYDRRPEDQFIEVRETVSRTVEIVGKIARTLYNGLSLLKLPPEIQAAIRRNTPCFSGVSIIGAHVAPSTGEANGATPSCSLRSLWQIPMGLTTGICLLPTSNVLILETVLSSEC